MRKSRADERQGVLLLEPAPGEKSERSSPPRLDHAELIGRLARGDRLLVLTPNLRLAQALLAEVDAAHAAAGRTCWEAPDILAFEAYLRRCHEEARYASAGAAVPTLLSPSAGALLWESAVRESRWRESLLSLPAAAKLAAEAWELAHAWRIEGALQGEPGSEDAEAFAAWAEHYRRQTQGRGAIDMARLPGAAARWLAEGVVGRPQHMVFYAFDRITPQQGDFAQACRRAGIEVSHCDAPVMQAHVRRVECETPRRELEQAAAWARARLEANPAARIAVVIPELAKRRREALRIFARVLPTPERKVPLFNLSLGEPLSSYPLVDAALALIELASGPLEFERASRVLRSPFIAGGEDELDTRARLDAALRRTAPASLSLARLCQLVAHAQARQAAAACPRLEALLGKLLDISREARRAPPCDWARFFTRLLDAAGFPGERTLDSNEYQALARWREVLAELASLTLVAPEWSALEARARLQRLCADALFQPRSGAAPVQVLGLLESVGLAFDHLWVSGMDEATWPIPARAHPLIPPSLQRRAGIPQASAESAFEFDAAITRGWMRAAAEVVFSSARADGDRELLASPLVASVPVEDPDALSLPAHADRRLALFEAGRGKVSSVADAIGPPVQAGRAQGGTGILVDQAACPFRAFAHYRLDARRLERPEPGLGPLERGTLLHSMMARVWEQLKDSASLAAVSAEGLSAIVEEAARHAVERVQHERPGRLDGRFAELERQRLAGIAREWLELEKQRPPFEVVSREQPMKLAAGNLQIDGRIDRLDRLDGGGLAVIDYKSGRASVASWLGARPDDAQLPLYALAAGEEDVRAVAFARLKTGDRGFTGLARDPQALPEVRTIDRLKMSWTELMAMWRREVDALGENFAAGDGLVDPKELLLTCRRCDLKVLCRVHERLSPLDEGDEEETDDMS